jgi:phospholipid N-methyltransferase
MPAESACMTASDKIFAGSIPEIYDRFLVPLIFQPYALDLARRLAKIAPRDVLEIAAGTGVLTRAIAAVLPAETRIAATDLNQPMLDHAMARQRGDRRIAWQQQTPWRCRSTTRHSMPSFVNLGRCFFPTRFEPTARRAASCGRAGISC